MSGSSGPKTHDRRGGSIRRDAPDASYSQVAKTFHWLVVALIVVQFAIAWTMPDVGRGARPIGLIGWHLTVGTTILAVVFLRFAWRLTHPAPSPPADLPAALAALSRATHYGLYALLIILPLMGWANASARDWPVKLFAFIPLPHLGRGLNRSEPMRVAASMMAERKLRASLSKRVAMRRNCLSLQKYRSTRLRWR